MVSFSDDQLIKMAKNYLADGDYGDAVRILQKSNSKEGWALKGEAAYQFGKSLVGAGEYGEAKEHFATAAVHHLNIATKMLAKERGELINRILNKSITAVTALKDRLANVRFSPAIAMPNDIFAPLIENIACPAAYRSGYDPMKSDPLSALIRLVKRGVRESTLQRLGEIMADFAFNHSSILKDCDFIMPAPADPQRSAERGYSIPGLLAGKVAMSCAIPLHSEVIKPTGPLPELRTMPRWARPIALANAFEPTSKAKILEDMNVVIIDDVITTGSTMRRLAEECLECGAKKISALALAHTERSDW